MIFTIILLGFLGLASVITNILPAIISFPAEIITAINTFMNFITISFQILAYLYGAPLLIAMTLLSLVIFNFENIWRLSWFILAKVPLLNRLIRWR